MNFFRGEVLYSQVPKGRGREKSERWERDLLNPSSY